MMSIYYCLIRSISILVDIIVSKYYMGQIMVPMYIYLDESRYYSYMHSDECRYIWLNTD